jgi:hypothetical protein
MRSSMCVARVLSICICGRSASPLVILSRLFGTNSLHVGSTRFPVLLHEWVIKQTFRLAILASPPRSYWQDLPTKTGVALVFSATFDFENPPLETTTP